MNRSLEVMEGLNILKRYDGFYIYAEHDTIYTGVKLQDVPFISTQRLKELNFHDDEGMWAVFT